MSSEKEFDLDEWIKQEKEIHFPAKRKPYNIAPDRAFELGLEWGFDKGQEQAAKRILEGAVFVERNGSLKLNQLEEIIQEMLDEESK